MTFVFDQEDEERRLPWPVAVYADRYGGVYSGGRWLAVCGWGSLFESGAYASDVPCAAWWLGQESDRVGRGPTPEAALADLFRRWVEAGGPSGFGWDKWA